LDEIAPPRQLHRYVSMILRRVIVAFLVAPLMTPLVLTVSNYVRGYGTLFLGYGIFAYFAATIFGVPAFLIYRALKWTNIFLFALGGALIGIIVSLPIYWEERGEYVWCALAGAVSALVFRIIVYGFNLNGIGHLKIEGET
jgi:hypothetical protein